MAQSQAQQVLTLYRDWRAGKLRIELSRSAVSDTACRAAWRALATLPGNSVLIVLSIAGFLLVYLGAPLSWLAQLTFSPFGIVGEQLQFAEMGAQYWRLVTPAFIHFGWLHIVFNSLWLWDLGSRVEQVMGSMNMLLLFVVIALVSNASCQFIFGGPGLFGGMSGVVYGLLGFSWVAPLLQPRWRIQPAPAIMLFMVGWLVVCMLGLVEVLGFGAIANAAHLGGLVSGALLGAAFAGMSRMTGGNNE